MLPQVATHVFHHTTRAVAAAPTIRNVLGTTSTPDRTHGHGAGAGGSKYHAGSRFYSGYTGPGRAVTQANTTTANDAPQADEDDLRASSSRRKIRARSSSFSLGTGAHGRTTRAQSLGVLRAIQAHYHSRQALASIPRKMLAAAPATVEQTDPERPTTPRLVRRNSTASTVSLSSVHDEPMMLSRAPSPELEPPPIPEPPAFFSSPKVEEQSEIYRLLDEAKGDSAAVRAVIERLCAPETKSVVSEWNAAIRALASVRLRTEPLSEVLQLYNDMVDRNIRPDLTTYDIMLEIILQRDHFVRESIVEIKNRITRRALLTLGEVNDELDFTDRQAIAAFEVESNYASALAIFNTVNTVEGWRFDTTLYFNLLRACADRADVKSALQIFAHIEKCKMRPLPTQYSILLRTYANAGDFEGAKFVFEEAVKLQKDNVFELGTMNADGRGHLIDIYNEMIRTHILAGNAAEALALLEQMMDTPNGTQFAADETPCPSAHTYDTIIKSFCDVKDLKSAFHWYRQLCKHGRPQQQLRGLPLGYAPRPIPSLLMYLAHALATEGMVEELNTIAREFTSNFFVMPNSVRFLIYATNIRDLEKNTPPPDALLERLDWVFATVVERKEVVAKVAVDFLQDASAAVFAPAVRLYAHAGNYARAAEVALLCADGQRRGSGDGLLVVNGVWASGNCLLDALVLSHDGTPLTPPLSDLQVAYNGWKRRNLRMPMSFALAVVRALDYEIAQGTLASRSGYVLGMVANELPYGSPSSDPATDGRIEELLKATEAQGWKPQVYGPRLIRVLIGTRGRDATAALLASLGPHWEALLPTEIESAPATPELSSADSQSLASSDERASTPTTDVSSTGLAPEQHIDMYLSGLVTDLGSRKTESGELEEMFNRLVAESQRGVYAYPNAYAMFLSILGRRRDIARMEALYGIGHSAVPFVQKTAQRDAWRVLEDAMIIGYAHAGEPQRADVHRLRLLEEELTPSPDAYAALVQAVHDTTDDTANAMAYFDEARMRGVRPNLFMYNTAISKLAKARKADQALELFAELKASGAKPSTVTYGALISACCRVGDVLNAEGLFEEMLQSAQNARLRVPPFNTMMQFFVHTKPNRGRFLQYYSRLRRAGIPLTEHTYKLVLDAYGTIEPVDFTAMEATFDQLSNDRNVKVHGVHWASLINAYGCVDKDLQKAIDVFESIPLHRQTPRKQPRAAVVYEALFNVLITHHRMDLVPAYLERMQAEGVRLTAYVLNPLIRGHALVGDIDSARAVFAGMVDPPAGVAAPHNHASHDPARAAADAGADAGAPVYREPSTWEAMIRAELGMGNRNEAIALLERLRERHYPESIFNRISGIMLDDTVSPWPATMSPDHPLASVKAATT